MPRLNTDFVCVARALDFSPQEQLGHQFTSGGIFRGSATNRTFMPIKSGLGPKRYCEKHTATLAIVHHANQYIISDGYTNRSGIRSVVGTKTAKRGLAYILELHRKYRIPANIHLSGTLLESLAWFQPQILTDLREMYRENLLEIVGSTYSQNIMRFFSYDYNLRQINEELALCEMHLGIEPRSIKSFWPPERVWDTCAMASVIRDPALLNGGFDSVFIDDRVLLAVSGNESPRHLYDGNPTWDPMLFNACLIADGQGLIALPIATNLRLCIPPRSAKQQQNIERQLRWLSSLDAASYASDFIAIYGDDMEKPAAVGWDPDGPSNFEEFLRSVSNTSWARPVKISEWTSTARIGAARNIEGGTYLELARQFGAGELYEKWYFDPRWAPYRDHFAWSGQRVDDLSALRADPALIQLAQKHLLASTWETAWHTPAEGAHGDPASDGGPSGSSRAVASHCRHAAMIAEAAYWQAHKDGESHCYLRDVDNDGEEELIFENRNLVAVLSPKRGGRLIALFSVEGKDGKMVVGNPCDDWNLKEELHDYMDIPPNHPGALADVGFEHDSYTVDFMSADGGAVHARLRNDRTTSLAFGLTKDISIHSYQDSVLHVEYSVPENISLLEVEFGLSPDYMNLLRKGRSILKPYDREGARGWSTQDIAVWVKPAPGLACGWTSPYQEEFGHGCSLRLSFEGRRLEVTIGVERMAQTDGIATAPAIFEEEKA